MSGSLLLGVDIGTYSAKGVLCQPDGQVLASHTVEHELSLPRPGWAEHDPEKVWWGGFVQISQALLRDGYTGDDVGAVAVSGIGPCMLPVDRNGNALRPAVLYGIDTRASDEIAELNATLGEAAIYELGGTALTSQAVGPKILWLRRHEPDIYARTAKILNSSSYLVGRLTGEFVVDRHTASYYTPLIDLATLEWSDRFGDTICSPDKLPHLLWATEIAGTVTESAGSATGLLPGTPVTAGTIDAAAEAISVGIAVPGDMMMMYGTTMFFIEVTDQPRPDPRMWATAYVLPGRYDIAGGMATSGALTRWFRDQLGTAEVASEQTTGESAYASLARLGEQVPPGANGLVCLPYFAGERTPINDPLARGVFAGLTLSHTRAHLYRAMLEGTAYGLRHNVEVLTNIGARPDRLVAVGGGANNRLWLQIISDVTGLMQMVPERTIGASYGDAFLAGLASGLVPSLDRLAQDWVRPATIIEPQAALAPVYDTYYDVFRNLYEHAKPELHALARLGLGLA